MMNKLLMFVVLFGIYSNCYCRIRQDSISVDDYIKYSDAVAEIEIMEVDTFQDGRGLLGYSVGFSIKIMKVLMSKEKISNDSGVIIRCERHYYGQDNRRLPLGNYPKGQIGLTFLMVFDGKIDCIAFPQSNAFYKKGTEEYDKLKKKISSFQKGK